MTNKVIWDQCSKPPKTALKQIQSGTLKGMTDIKPQWRYEIMTDMFGPCGTGWGYTIDKLWTEEADKETLCFALVTVWYKERDNTIQGCGGSKLTEYFSQKQYSKNNDEGFKMAITDAFSTALKMLGVGADVYFGRWDGSKYKDEPKEKPTAEVKPLPAGDMETVNKLLVSADTLVKVDNIAKSTMQYTWTEPEMAQLKVNFVNKRQELKNG